MRVVWSDEAWKLLDNILQECENRFGKKNVEKFLGRVKRCNQSLVDNPYMGKLEPLLEYLPLSLRTFVLHPYYKIVYYVNEFEDCIYVITLWDSRRDPEEYVKELFGEKKD